MSTSILLVDHDRLLGSSLVSLLTQNGYDIGIEISGERAIARVRRQRPTLVILEVELPDRSGISVCRTIRNLYDGPILMWTAKPDPLNEVNCLKSGADDYIFKPVDKLVLLARINTLLRRFWLDRSSRSVKHDLIERHEHGDSVDVVTVGPLSISAIARSVHLEGEPVWLTSAEFDLLWLLARHAGAPLSRDLIRRHLYGREHDGLDRTIDLRVSRVRRKLRDKAGRPRFIKSVRGVGYMLVNDQNGTPGARRPIVEY